MSCGCGGGGGGYIGAPNYIYTANQTVIPCDYTIDQLVVWRDLMMCVKNNNLYDIFHISKPVFNSYMGNLISAINYTTNICFFKPQLDLLQILITQIINSGECPIS